jgi:steroid 5-alpha reductase family enzyme
MNAALSTWATALPALVAFALIAWAIATARRNVGLVDIGWPLFFLLAAAVYASSLSAVGPRGWLTIVLVAAWGLRLSGYLAARNWNAPEDRRYRAIRARNEPGFAWKSLYLVFGLQALLAWLISAPLAPAIRAAGVPGVLDWAGAALAAFGIAYESIADRQLAKFLAEHGNSGRVMDRGLWRYSRHPNYFGECGVWWGFYLVAAGAGGAWTVFSPLLMTFLLLRVSGVSLLEKDIGDRRPAYRAYAMCTNAFLPGARRSR